MELLKEKIGGQVALDDLAIAGASKYFIEKLATPYINNGTLMSGAIKLAASSLIPKSSKWSKDVALGVGIDAVEDILFALLGSTAVGSQVEAMII